MLSRPRQLLSVTVPPQLSSAHGAGGTSPRPVVVPGTHGALGRPPYSGWAGHWDDLLPAMEGFAQLTFCTGKTNLDFSRRFRWSPTDCSGRVGSAQLRCSVLISRRFNGTSVALPWHVAFRESQPPIRSPGLGAREDYVSHKARQSPADGAAWCIMGVVVCPGHLARRVNWGLKRPPFSSQKAMRHASAIRC